MLDRTQAPAGITTFDFTLPQAHTREHKGTKFHFIHAGNQPVVKIEVIFRNGGSTMDRHPGEAFMTNKMLLHGNSSMDTATIAETLDKYGAFVRLAPSFDDPSLELYCLIKHLGNVLPVIRDILSDSIFPEDEFLHVRDITIEQLKIQNSRNNILASKIFRSNLFGADHPYGKVLQETDLEQLKPENLQTFFKNQLSEFEVIIVGELTENELNMISEHLALSRPAQATTFNSSVIPGGKKIYEEKENSLQTSLRLGCQAPLKSHPDYIPLRICIHALGGYFGSRLMKNIREDKGFTYGIHASLVPLVHNGYMSIGTDVQKEFRVAAIEEVYNEIHKLQKEEIPEEELTMVKNHLLGSFQSDLDSPMSLSSKFKGVYLYGLTYEYYDRLIETIRDITADEIRKMAMTYLKTDTFTEVSVG